MRLSQVGEAAIIDEIRSAFPRAAGAVKVGIGDDAAVLNLRGGNLLVTKDLMLEGIHFDLSLVTPFQLGFKLVSVNVSDIFAMGGSPSFMLLGLAAPGDMKKSFLDKMLLGIRHALDLYKLRLVGGDLSASQGALVLSATVFGKARKVIKRSGARPGDKIYVTGPLGDAACGLHLLRRIGKPVDLDRPCKRPLSWQCMEPLLRRHLMPVVRRPGLISRLASAMIDVSDGLLLDLKRLCDESRTGARIYHERLPVSPGLMEACRTLAIDPYKMVFSGGEDYELLFTAPSSGRLRVTCIGEVTKSGFSVVQADGTESAVSPEGYLHFKKGGAR